MLYTGKGDGGTTKVLDSKERIPKSSELPEALGTLDELNSFLGLARAAVRAGTNPDVTVAGRTLSMTDMLRDVQETLFIVQAEAAGADKRVAAEKVEQMSAAVNAIEAVIPQLTGFSIAGGTELSALLDVARTLARRAERRLVALEEGKLRVLAPDTKAYMNRLSSLLFALARLANHAAGVAEENPTYK
ncbi:MAG TPA: cob(I)yrinic acid a,c-diamide adenosyltransferase [Candidatus Paceibacterota bacterium]